MIDFGDGHKPQINSTQFTPHELNELNMHATENDFSQRVFNKKLMALRAQNPFIQIMPLPNHGTTVQLVPGIPQDITIPTGAKLAYFSGDGLYYMSRNGNAQVPSATQDKESSSLMNFEQFAIYVEEVRSISVICPTLDNFGNVAPSVNLTVGFFEQL